MYHKNNSLSIRIIFLISLLVAAFFLPWWLVAVSILIGFLSFSWFFEGVLIALLVDVSFAPGVTPWLAVLSLLALLIIEAVVYYVSRL